MAMHRANRLTVRLILPGCFDHLAESFFHKEVQLKEIQPLVKPVCPPAKKR